MKTVSHVYLSLTNNMIRIIEIEKSLFNWEIQSQKHF